METFEPKNESTLGSFPSYLETFPVKLVMKEAVEFI
jgi:hypothetical protein